MTSVMTKPAIPTTMSTTPTVDWLIPLTVVVTANFKIAPIAINIKLEPDCISRPPSSGSWTPGVTVMGWDDKLANNKDEAKGAAKEHLGKATGDEHMERGSDRSGREQPQAGGRESQGRLQQGLRSVRSPLCQLRPNGTDCGAGIVPRIECADHGVVPDFARRAVTPRPE
jgi:hypothetical protein